MKILSSTSNFSIENLLFKPCTLPTPTPNAFGTAPPIVPIPMYPPFFATMPTQATASTTTIFTPPSLIFKSDKHSASLHCKNNNNNSSQQIGTSTTTKSSTNYAIQKLSAISSGKRKRRHRTIFTEYQLYTLEEVFITRQYLDVQFPADDSAAASDGQAVAKWLFTPLQNDMQKVFKCWLEWDDGHLASRIEDFKRVFASASSPVNFIAVIRFPPLFADSVVPFDLTNELTREQLTLKRMNDIGRFLLIRCPIERAENKWAKWEKEAIDWQFMISGTESTFVFRDAMIGPK